MEDWFKSPWVIAGACTVAGAGLGAWVASRYARPGSDGLSGDPSKSGMPKALHEYACRVGTRRSDAHRAIHRYTVKLGRASRMCISADEGQFLEFFARTMGAKTCVEVGCFTGYGSLCLALGSTGTVFTLDIADTHIAQAERAWASAGVRERIEHMKAPATDSMRLLERLGTGTGAAKAVRSAIAAGEEGGSGTAGHGTVDIVFVDADKSNYQAYVDSAHRLLRVGGVCLVDNTLWGGRVIDSTATDEDTSAIKALNKALVDDSRWEICLLPIADGVTMLRKL